ncbi:MULTISPECIES: bifunctional 5,10-methylenetetrahydrofolate dehydrogenase/5,10-methenyltetrahydrofolate cyclohydrolase [unclassified Veillonella]|uniref:bifunctional 5,10-methylenetetrahydrofolate dehydrogenase/5,10-methenyltetrahydrofolate cyclohydrolase n=1 Tax=unclassified Veillonella TaxID=2630086 RepID=UPI000F8D51E9|nr:MULTISPECIES: bifunctional 5,10-methylenetetrahydrofolate dehydrogenase/5,10-methenyltetrahydrofolate cyclohydrolase [unclassified Veillonella]
MIELLGKPVAQARKAVLQENMQVLVDQGVTITLGILLVGDDSAAKMYATFMEKVAKGANFDTELVELPETATQEEVEAVIHKFNADERIYGVLPLMPMPKHIDSEAVIGALDPAKDIDGLTTYNIGLVSSGKGGYVPCTPKACMAIVDHYGIELSGKKVVVLGRSQVVGKPVALLALERNATVTICHSRTQNLEAELAQADVVIAAVGKAHMVHGTMLKEGCVVIDVGINELEGQTVGDVDFASAREVASAITPVPGGVGSVTTTMMLEGLYEAYYARNGHC